MSSLSSNHAEGRTGRWAALVIEDDPSTMRLIRLGLEKLPIAVHGAPNGELAASFLEGNRVDLICLDLMLPNQSGFELCEMIRKSPRHSDVPVLVISARSEPEAQAYAEEAGASAFLVKPFRFRELEAHTRRLLGLSSEGDER